MTLGITLLFLRKHAQWCTLKSRCSKDVSRLL